MARPGRILTGAIAALVVVMAADRFVLGPIRIEAALDALPRLTLARAIGPTETLDAIVLLDDAAGWYMVDGPASHADATIGMATIPAGPNPASDVLDAEYCGDDRGQILWAVRAAQIVAELATCDAAALDLRALRSLATPIRLERDLLTKAELDLLRAEIAGDPRRQAVTLPSDPSDLPLERVVALPWIWRGAGQGGGAEEPLAAGRAAIEAALGDHAGGFEIEPLRQRAVPAAGIAGPVLSLDGGAAVLRELTVLARPVYRVRCVEAACAALEGFDIDGRLDPWRDRAVLDAALASAQRIDPDTLSWQPPGRPDLLDDAATVAPVEVPLYPVRVARRL